VSSPITEGWGEQLDNGLVIQKTTLSADVVLALVPRKLLFGHTLVPGVSSCYKNTELFLFKDEDALHLNLDELGECFIVAPLSDFPNTMFVDGMYQSSPLATWNLRKAYYAVPLEFDKAQQRKVTSGHSWGGLTPLFKCSSALLYDASGGETKACLDQCRHQLQHLMGACQLGGPKCTEGLQYASPN
jgi:hypothetical protein